MTRIRYSKDVDALLIELSDSPIDHAGEAGQLIMHFSRTGEPVLLEILDARDFMAGCPSGRSKGRRWWWGEGGV